MVESQIRNRHRLRRKVIRELDKKFTQIFSQTFKLEDSIIDSAILDRYMILIIDNEILGLVIDDEPFLTIRGLLHYQPEHKYVTVDMGAVKFVTNGADVMAPGVVDADKNIEVNDQVWVRDEKNLRPLAIGHAFMSGMEMVASKSDKAVKLLHYVGDKLWETKISG